MKWCPLTLCHGCKFSGLFVGVSKDRSMQLPEMLQAFVDVAAQIEDKQGFYKRGFGTF